MKASWKVVGFGSIVFCLLLLFAAAPSVAHHIPCGPGGAGCQGCGGGCTGVACAVPYQAPPSPGYCTPAQIAAGGRDISASTSCAGSLAGVCLCYLPSWYQIIQQNCFRIYYLAQPGDEPLAIGAEPMVIANPATCATSEEPMAPKTSPVLVEEPDEAR